MKKCIMWGLGALMLASCGGNQKQLQEDSIRIADLTSEYEQATDFNDSLMLLMGDIYTGLDSINMQEGLLYSSQGEGVNRRDEIRANLSNIKSRLAANKQLLEQMEARLKTSGNKNAVLVKTITQLKDHIAQQDTKIAQLEGDLSSARGQIQDLNTKVAEGQEQVRVETAAKEEAQAEAIAAQNEAAKANKVYYAVGTSSDLKRKGLLEKKFLGSTKVMTGDFDASYFMSADLRNLKSIPTGAKKIKIWSNMPAGSYQITGDKDSPKTIEILDPAKFWSISRYLIVQVD